MVQPKAVAMRAQSRSPKQLGENPYQSARQGVPSILLSSSEATAGSLCTSRQSCRKAGKREYSREIGNRPGNPGFGQVP